MADEKALKRTEKIQIMLDDDELAAIDDWRFDNRLPSRAAAIRELIRRGLVKDDEFKNPPSDAASGDFRVTEAPDE
ncbi:MAG: ribbon-helix-helix protein, CopG family [Methyloligellaceae bacterium]